MVVKKQTAATPSKKAAATPKKSSAAVVEESDNNNNSSKSVEKEIEIRDTDKPVSNGKSKQANGKSKKSTPTASSGKEKQQVEEQQHEQSPWNKMDVTAGGSFIDVSPVYCDEYFVVTRLNKLIIYTEKDIFMEYKFDSFITCIHAISSRKQILVGTMGTITRITIGNQEKEVLTLPSFFSNMNVDDIVVADKPESEMGSKELRRVRMRGKIMSFMNSEDPVSMMITNIVSVPDNSSTIFYTTPLGLFKIDWSTSNQGVGVFTPNSSIIYSKERSMFDLRITPSGNYLATRIGKRLMIFDAATPFSCKALKAELMLTTIAMSPKGEVSFGVVSGRVFTVDIEEVFTSNPNRDHIPQEEYTKKYIHWHSGPVKTITYSEDGLLMVTGGLERAIVVYTTALGTKRVIPSLGGEVVSVSVSPDGSSIATTLANNRIKFINTSDDRASRVITGIRFGAQNPLRGMLNVPFKPDTIALYGEDNFIQMVDPFKNIVHSDVEITPSLNTTISTDRSRFKYTSRRRMKIDCSLHDPVVDLLAFHDQSPTMVTYEHLPRSGDVNGEEHTIRDRILKFWIPKTKEEIEEEKAELEQKKVKDYSNRSIVEKTYDLIFSCTNPHMEPVISMEFHPTKMLLVTGSTNEFKVWEMGHFNTVRNGQELGRVYWTCVFQHSYHNLPCSSISFSHDGTTMAVATGHLITLWDVTRNFKQVGTLTRCGFDSISKIAFLQNPTHLYAQYQATGACIWDLETLTELIVIPQQPYHFATSNDGKYFAIACDLNYKLKLPNQQNNYEHQYQRKDRLEEDEKEQEGENTQKKKKGREFIENHAIIVIESDSKDGYKVTNVTISSRVNSLLFGKDRDESPCLFYASHFNFISGITLSTKHSIQAEQALQSNLVQRQRQLASSVKLNVTFEDDIKDNMDAAIEEQMKFDSKRQKEDEIQRKQQTKLKEKKLLELQSEEEQREHAETAALTVDLVSQLETENLLRQAKEQVLVVPSTNKTKQLFNPASHIIPGVQSLYQSYMDSILVTNQHEAFKVPTTNNQNNNNNNNTESNGTTTTTTTNSTGGNKNYGKKTTISTSTTKQPETKQAFSSFKNFFDDDGDVEMNNNNNTNGTNNNEKKTNNVNEKRKRDDEEEAEKEKIVEQEKAEKKSKVKETKGKAATPAPAATISKKEKEPTKSVETTPKPTPQKTPKKQKK